MNTNVRSTAIPESNQASADQADTQDQVEASTFRVQTGVRAGGFYDDFYSSFFSATEDYNQADRSSTAAV
jgi:hypothetical protein